MTHKEVTSRSVFNKRDHVLHGSCESMRGSGLWKRSLSRNWKLCVKTRSPYRDGTRSGKCFSLKWLAMERCISRENDLTPPIGERAKKRSENGFTSVKRGATLRLVLPENRAYNLTSIYPTMTKLDGNWTRIDDENRWFDATPRSSKLAVIWTLVSAYHNHFVSGAHAPIFPSHKFPRKKLSGFQRYPDNGMDRIGLSPYRDRGDTDSLQKTAIQIVKNGCDMKSRKATRHNQFDDWIALRSRFLHRLPSIFCLLHLYYHHLLLLFRWCEKHTRANEEKWKKKKRAIKNRSEDYAIIIIRCSSSIHGWLLIKRALSVFERSDTRTHTVLDDRFCGPSSSKWLWYDSKHSTTNLMYRTAKGIFISVLYTRYNVRLSLSLSLTRSRSPQSVQSLPFRVVPPFSILPKIILLSANYFHVSLFVFSRAVDGHNFAHQKKDGLSRTSYNCERSIVSRILSFVYPHPYESEGHCSTTTRIGLGEVNHSIVIRQHGVFVVFYSTHKLERSNINSLV